MKKFNKKEYMRKYMKTYMKAYYKKNAKRIQEQRKISQKKKAITEYLEGKIVV